MEKTNKFSKKLISIFWFIIYMIPLIIFLGYFIVNIRNGGEFIQSNAYGANIYILFENFTEDTLDFLNDSVITITLNKFINIFIENTFTLSNNAIIKFISSTLAWYIITMLIHIIVDFILILPNICKKLFRKGGLDNE